MNKLILSSFVFLLVGCAPLSSSQYQSKTHTPVSSFEAIPAVRVEMSAEKLEKAKLQVSKGLKDPYSAQFSELYGVRTRKGKVIICGTVNAKNSYGGYTGEKTFFIDTSNNELFYPSGKNSDLIESIAISNCTVND